MRQWAITVVTRAVRPPRHRRGIDVHVWTIDDAAEMDRLLDLGVDGIMTDRPAVLRDVLGELATPGTSSGERANYCRRR